MPIDMSSQKTFGWLVVALCLGRALFEAISGTVLGLVIVYSLSTVLFAYFLKWLMPFFLAVHRVPIQRDVAVNWILLIGVPVIVGFALLKALLE